MSFYWCLEHKGVEKNLGCGSTSRIGPYESQADAMTALERTRQHEAEQKVRDETNEKKYGKRRG